MNPNYRLIEGPYIRDLLKQPDAIWETSEALAESLPTNLPGQYRHGAFDRLLLTGMGSSFHALQALTPRLANLGLPTLAIETSELIHSQRGQLSPRSLVIAVSQSGSTIEIVRLLDLLPQGAHLLAVTNTPDSPLAQRASTRLLTQAGTEGNVSSKTYVATVTALLWIGEWLQGVHPPAASASIGRAADAVADYLSWWSDHVEQLAGLLLETRQVYITGRGASLAAASTGALVIKEAARFPAEGMSSAAFRHGPLEITGPNTAVFVLEGASDTAPLNQQLAIDIQALGGPAFLIGRAVPTAALKLPLVNEPLLPLVEILPLQMASLALAALAGREAGRFEKARKVTSSE